MLPRRVEGIAVAAIAVIVSACAVLEPIEPTPTQLRGPTPIVLPGEGDLVPTGIAGVGGWSGTTTFPAAFDGSAVHDSPEAVADAFIAALSAAYANMPMRPTHEVAAVGEQASNRTLVVITELGAGDDSVAGTQYAVVAEPNTDGWRLTELYTRALCRRGVTNGLCL